jgi:tripartite motif-containing protein 71
MTASSVTTTDPVIDAQPEEEKPRRRRKLFILFFLLALLAMLIGLAIWYLTFRQPIPLPALPGQVVMPTYSTSIYGPDRPMGVAVTPDGSLVFIGETESKRTARVYDAGGTAIAEMLPPVSTGAEHVPVYLARQPITGDVYVTDRPTGSIYIYNEKGEYQRTFDPGADLKGWQPLGITFDPTGNMYVTDVSTQPQAVLVFDPQGKKIKTLGASAGMNFPNGVALDKAGNVYVADSSNGRVVVLSQDDKVLAQVGRGTGEGKLGLPRGIAIDGSDHVFVVDSTGQSVNVFGTYTGEGTLKYLGLFGGEGVGNGTFLFPNGVTVDSRGRIYVTDAGNDRVQVWSY